MPGLLDFLNSDEAALGLGLLAAGGPTSDPNSSGFGARLAQGVGYAQARKDGALRNKLLQSQVDENSSQAALRQQQLALAMRKQALDEQFMGAGPPAGAAGVPSLGVAPGAAPSGASSSSAAGMPVGGGFTAAEIAQKFGIPIQAVISDYRFNGGKKIAELINDRTKPDWQTQDGFTFNRNTPEFAGGFLPGLTTSANGTSTLRIPDQSAPGGVRIAAPAGALAAAGAYEEQQARTRAAYTPGAHVIGPGDRKYGQSQLAEIGGGSPPVGPAPRPMIGPGFAGGSSTAAAGGQAEILTSELTKAQAELTAATQRGDAAGAARAQSDIAGLNRELTRLPGGASAAGRAPLIGPGAGRGNQGVPMAPAGSGPAGALDFSPDEKAAQEANRARSVEQAKADVTPTAQKVAKFTAAGDAINLIDKALAHPGLPKATGLSSLNPINKLPGSEGRDFGAIQDQLRGTAFLSAYNELKGGGAITEVEGKKAEDAIARLSTAQSTKAYKEALGDYRAIIKRGLDRAAGTVPADATPPTDPGWRAKGYASQDAALKDAQNAILRGAPRDKVQARLKEMGLSLPAAGGGQGSW